jgi:glycosyltransferase involved in cell wall biosynthesis
MKPRISAIINTLNEEKNLPFALRSVQPWVDEIVVVDMHSEDRTVEIAREFGAKVFSHERAGFADPARAFAIARASGDWILMLDADELVPFPLSRKLREIAETDIADIVRIPWVNYLLGAPMMHTGWGPHQDIHARFFRRGFLQATDEVHNFLKAVPDARIVELTFEPGCAVVHFNYLNSEHFIEKLNRYTTIEARQAFERGERITPLRAALIGVKEFWIRYLRGQGFRDGWRGFYLSVFMVFYRAAAAAKLQELRVVGPREVTEARYRQEAEKILGPYSNSELPETT